MDCDLYHDVSQLISFIIIKKSIYSSARRYHTAWTPPSHPNSIVLLGGDRFDAFAFTAEIWPGFQSKVETVNVYPGGGSFWLYNNLEYACGIPDGETIVMTGGYKHSFVTRCSFGSGGAV